MNFAVLQKQIGYQFQQPDLLQQALTHRSAGKQHNERLEFLGDAILGFEIADYLYQKYPHSSEGKLSRARSELVKRETLAKIARRIKLNDHLILGGGELRSGGKNRTSTLADAVEALIAAVYLDGGLTEAKALIQRLFSQELQNISPHTQNKDPKTRLQEYLQGKGLELPVYQIIEISGQPHQQTFMVECQVKALQLKATGEESSRRKAEQQAAQALLDQIMGAE